VLSNDIETLVNSTIMFSQFIRMELIV
jgi:hypothetical protein